RLPEWATARKMCLLAASFFIMMMESGIRQTMNVFAAAMQDEFKCDQYTALMIVVVIPNASSLMTGPIAAVLYNVFGARVTVTAGSILTALGFVGATFITSIYQMIFFSIIIGLGCGMMRNAVISVHCEYFPIEIRNTTISFICIGPGIGIFVFPRLFKICLDVLHWSSAFYGIAVLYCACGVMGMFIAKCPSRKRTLCDIFGLAIWKHPGFIANEFAAFFASTTCMVYVSKTLGWMKLQNVDSPEFLYSYSGIASIVGRVGLTLLLGMKLPVGILMIFSFLFGQLAVPMAGFCSEGICFGAQNALVGLGSGFYQTCLSPYLMHYLGPELLSSAFGFTNLINGAAALLSIFLTDKVTSLFDDPLTAEFIFLAVIGILSCLAAGVSYICFARYERPGVKVVKQPLEVPIENGHSLPEQKSKLLGKDSITVKHKQTDSEDLREAVRDYIRKCTLDQPPQTLHEYANDMGRPMDEETRRRLTGDSED
ncbi:hypothetical protein PENTCL1PPCAC_29968, partial [Pristionchus entomophagus]